MWSDIIIIIFEKKCKLLKSEIANNNEGGYAYRIYHSNNKHIKLKTKRDLYIR